MIDRELWQKVYAGWIAFTSFLGVFFVYCLIKALIETNWYDTVLWFLQNGPEFVLYTLLTTFALSIAMLVYGMVRKQQQR